MASPHVVRMEEISLGDDERGSIEYKILMAYAQRRLSVRKYGTLLENEANVWKPSPLTKRKVKLAHQRDTDGPIPRAVYEGGVVKKQSKEQPKQKPSTYPFHTWIRCSGVSEEVDDTPMSGVLKLQGPSEETSQHQTTSVQLAAAQRAERGSTMSLVSPNYYQLSLSNSKAPAWGNVSLSILWALPPQGETSTSLNYFLERLIASFLSHPLSQSGETADVSHIADKLVKLVTSRPQETPSDVSFRTLDARSEEDDDDNLPGGSEGKERDEDKIIQEIVSLLIQEGDRLDKEIKKDKVLYQHFNEMLSYPFFKKITDLFLKGVVADSTTKPGDQLQCTKVAFTMEVTTRLIALDYHPMNLVLGFGYKYLIDHFKPWIQDRGGWEKALTSPDEEEVE
ncbi:PREDICTED: apoptosis facilitator Bcl-2-like protein 14 [Chaetura pelagica]|uniref:apoptosis facilitator Bcl-2-like protein 14 n=1 Tax=Chaetura pelagica TaxID=8897 RepID=UPI0005232227|nr:PREDICTED: apoptosis facilitator Bcl-2-like protein 14 [Chaetura pelagica]